MQKRTSLSAHKCFLLFFLIFGSNQLFAQNFPKLGNDTLLDIANWNIEWFGDVTNGPSDEATQFANVKALLDKTEMDVFALEEISEASAYANLSTQLAAKYDAYISSFSQTQKTGIYWRKSMFSVIPNLSYNLNVTSGDNYFYASRPPLQVCLQTIGGTKIDTLYFLVIHLKAYADVDSYNRRIGASAALKTYIEGTLTGKKVIVLGDWNDQLSASIYNSAESPFKNLLTANYTFPSKELEDAGKSSYAFKNSMIDHQLISHALDSFYYKGSAKVFSDAPTYCSGFSNNTSDHFPIYSCFNWKKLTTRIIPEGVEEELNKINITIAPNPTNTSITVQCDKQIDVVKIIDLQGRIVIEKANNLSKEWQAQIDLSNLEAGIYFVQIESQGKQLCRQIVKQ